MTRDDIIRMAESFGIPEFENYESQANNILNFFKAAYAAGAAAEREACAKVCDEAEKRKWLTVQNGGKLDGVGARDCAAAIRARGEQK